MSRLLFWLALAVLVVFALRAKIRAARARVDRAGGSAAPSGPASPSPSPTIESMTSCAHCGLYFPASEAVRADGLDYCCPAHVRLPAQ